MNRLFNLKSGVKKLIERLIIFFIGLPLVVSVIYFLPHYNFLVFHLVIIIFAILGTFEVYNLLSQKLNTFPRITVCLIGTILVMISYFSGLGILPDNCLAMTMGLFLVLILSMEVLFSFSGNFSKSISRFCTGIFMLVYPWSLVLYLSALTPLKDAHLILSFFFLLVFTCDSCAWLFGILFGSTTRGFIKASPKKSLIGFLGGFIGPIVVAIMFSKIFKPQFNNLSKELIIIAIVTALFAIIGDIIESILKRSVDVKDSGRIIMGRGGILDSIDSILIASPVFYSLYQLLIGGM